MGGGASRPQSGPASTASAKSRRLSSLKPQASDRPADEIVVEVPHEPTSAIDARIVQTLRDLNLARRQATSKVKSLNFERIVLRFGMARDAFETIHCIYYQHADDDGLTYEGLKEGLNALGAHMNETDMREIFYESDMVRDNSLSHNEFIVSLAISYLLGLITNFECILRTLPPDEPAVPAEVDAGGADDGTQTSRRDSSIGSSRAEAPAMISKTLELIVTAYLLFDDDASGTIQVGEVRNVMQKHESSQRRTLERKSSGMTTKAIRAARIQEMDLNSDGTITFQEFVLTFQKWVGIDET